MPIREWPESDVANGDNLREKAAKGAAVTLLAQGFRVILQLASVVVLARLISPAEFGLFAMVFALSSVALIFLDFGFSMAALRERNLTQQQQSNLFWINALAGMFLAAVIFLMAEPISLFYGEPQLVLLTQMVSTIYILGGLTAQFRVVLNRAMRFKALAIADVLSPVIALSIAIIMAHQGYGAIALACQQISSSLALLLMISFMARWRPSLPRRTKGMKPLLTFGFSFAGTRILSYLTQSIDSIAIGRVWGSVDLGFYDRAYKVSVAPISQISFPMTQIAMPVLTRVMDVPARYLVALREAQLIGTYVTASVLALICGLSEPAVALLFGEEWLTAAPIISVLCIGALFRTLQQVANWVLMSKGLANVLLHFNLLLQPIIILFTLAGLPWGPVGVAAGAAGGYAVYWITSIFWAGRKTNLNLTILITEPLRIVTTFGMPAGMIAFFISSSIQSNALLQLVGGLAGAGVWFTVVFFVSKSVKRDIKKLVSFVILALKRR